MSRSRMIISVLFAGAFSLLPLRVASNPAHNLPQFGISDACGASGDCCFQVGTVCLLEGEVMANRTWEVGGCRVE